MQYAQERFPSNDEFAVWLQKTFEQPHYEALQGALLTAAVSPTGRLISGRMLFARTPPILRSGAAYRDLQLREEWITRSQAVARLQQLIAGIGTVDGLSISDGFRVPEARYIVGPVSSESGFSEWQLTLTPTADGISPEPNYSLIAFGNPPYFSAGHAISEFVFQQSRPWQPGDRTDVGRLHVIIPDSRVRLAARWQRVEERVQIVLDGAISWEETEIQVVANSSPTFRDTRVGKPGTHDLPLPTDADQVFVAIAQRGGDLLAAADLRLPLLLSAGFDADPIMPDEETIRRDLSCGETDHVEFKPFVRPNHEKEMEIVETVIAFANSGGGRIYVGVDRNGTPQMEREVRNAKFDGPDPYSQVRLRLYRIIEDGSKPVPPFAAEVIATMGTKLVRVQVQQGRNPPYCTHNNDMFIRKGATNHKPDPQTELPTSSGIFR